MNDDELGFQILSPQQMFVKDDDLANMFLEDDDVDKNKNTETEGDIEGNAGGEEQNKPNSDLEFVPDSDLEKGGSINNYKETLKSLSKLGVIAEIDDTSVFAGDDGEEVSFADLKIDDEETYNEYVKILHEEKQKQLLENKADLGGVSDLTRKIIEIDKAGGNISAVLEVKSQALDPISGLDLLDVDAQKKVVSHYLQTRYADMSKDDIDELIKSYEDRGVLEEKATSYKASIESAVMEYAEKQKVAVEEQKKAFVEQFKGYKKSIKESVSTKFQLKDDYVKKVVEYATTLDERNNPGLLNKKYAEMLKNPDEAAELIMFLYDKDEYLRQKTNKVVTEERRNVFKKLTTKNTKGGANTADVTKADQEEDENFIPIKDKVIMRGNFKEE